MSLFNSKYYDLEFSNSFIDQEDNKKKQNKIMLGQKWIERTQMLKIDIEPEDNLKIYEE